ncbi:hypothetical protein AGOR_G00042580 [Albula goreensis]|uniref:alanine transaminase n=1 Tax=Albula goreensis TaxID=1534307 RepID=A0A8T3DYX7_9TELE|nr:hypothetical protein AGOR_G00042580 [Albula goreensis]
MALRVSTSLRLEKRAHQTIHWRRVCLSLEKEQIQMTHQKSHIGPERQQGVQKPYKDMIDITWGDPHRLGMKPISFVRQVIAACLYPELVHNDRFPIDVQLRAQRLLRACEGGSVGAYTATCGIPHVQRNLANFISRRDGGVPSHPENIFISSGSVTALTVRKTLLPHEEGPSKAGILIPVPGFATFHSMLETQGVEMVPYHLCEEEGWALTVEDLRRALQTTRGHCSPRALYIMNPGNPTGYVQSRESIEEVIRFAAEENLFLLADEVYQSNVYAVDREFISYKKVLSEMGPDYSDTVELVSFNSVSKGFMGECGLRGGYMELINLDPEVMGVVYTLFSTLSCPSVIGQIALDIMADPPQPGDPSYPTFSAEVHHNQKTLAHNVRVTQEVLGGLPGVTCQPVMGGFYIFPRLHLPPKAQEQARAAGMEADKLYCHRLLEEEAVYARPGGHYGQKEGTHHVRLCVMTTTENLRELLRRFQAFHLRFMKEFS